MKILLGVCGSIAAYRTPDIVRGLTKLGHEVRVILTKGAEQFVQPKVFGYLGAEETYFSGDDFNSKGVLHIDLVKWCDSFVIAPLSANTLAKLSQGSADDLLSSVFLAMDQNKPTQFYPAMNTKMYQHPFVQRNLESLKSLESTFICPPDSGELACGDHGEGKLPQIDRIIEMIPRVQTRFSKNAKTILITTGATIAPLDPVRYLTNASSGLTGFHLATKALENGHRVHLIAGAYASKKLDDLKDLPGFTLERVVTTKQMGEAVDKKISSSDIYISSAAICDLEFKTQEGKMKKKGFEESLPVSIDRDILKDIISKKSTHQKIVGFAAETELTDDILLEKWNKKPVDLLIGTHVHNGLTGNKEKQGFGVDSALYSFVENGSIKESIHLSKKQLAHEIIERILQ